MAKGTIKGRSPKLKNEHLIGGGAKFTPVYTNKGTINWRGSVMKQKGGQSLPEMPKSAPQKTVGKISTTFKTSFKAHQSKQDQQITVKAQTVRLQGLQKMKQNIAKSAPSPNITMQKKKEVAKTPINKGRGR